MSMLLTAQAEPQAFSKGTYQEPLLSFDCPQDQQQYGQSYQGDYEAATHYCGKTQPAGYWVWVAPDWYLWRQKDLSAIGFTTQSITLPFKHSLEVQIEYQQQNKVWADTTLYHFKLGVLALESWTQMSFPGRRPYLIEERPNFDLLGSAGRHKMTLASPPRGTPWTLFHEMIHIWNVDVTPSWFNEGQAKFISYLLIKDFQLPFVEPETWIVYQQAWEAIQGSKQDLPLQGHYAQLPQGKAMAFWRLMFELGGPELIRESFRYSVQNKGISLTAIQVIMDKHLGHLPLSSYQFLSGWVLPGPYYIKQAKELGPVRYPLP